jgi:predicted metal-dependent HD superfamily phosphohydrolase
MTQPETEIRSAWRHIAGHAHEGYVDALLARYAEPHRHYHTATHIMFVLRHLRDMAQASTTQPSPQVVAAALYHDAIYNPTVDTNEALSAVLAANDLAEIGWPSPRCESVAEMIIATAGHLADPADQRNDAGDRAGDAAAETAMLLDADLAILGSEPGAYQAYVNGVRAEYAHVDDGQWRTGRSRVLQHFLDRPRLFVTDFMYAAAEHRARANIEAELAVLSHRSAGND